MNECVYILFLSVCVVALSVCLGPSKCVYNGGEIEFHSNFSLALKWLLSTTFYVICHWKGDTLTVTAVQLQLLAN